MIAKLIVHGRDRNAALAALRRALAQTEIAGVATNVAFLGRLAASRAFTSAELDTGLIERNRAELFPPRAPVPGEMLAAAALAELAAEEAAARERARHSGDAGSPWNRVDGWRLNGESHHDLVFMDGEASHAVRVSFAEGGPRIKIGDKEFSGALQARSVRDGNDWHVFWNGLYRKLSLREELHEPEAAATGSLAAPMPGKIAQVLVQVGAKVKKGDALLILEAMKMEHTIAAPADGVVKAILFAAGEQVPEGAELVVLG
jgi:3-methylcrotonyl-CoA carboxylase alpha subunit